MTNNISDFTVTNPVSKPTDLPKNFTLFDQKHFHFDPPKVRERPLSQNPPFTSSSHTVKDWTRDIQASADLIPSQTNYTLSPLPQAQFSQETIERYNNFYRSDCGPIVWSTIAADAELAAYGIVKNNPFFLNSRFPPDSRIIDFTSVEVAKRYDRKLCLK